MATPVAEPPDQHVYTLVSFNQDTFEFYLAAVRFYESLLHRDLETVKSDVDLRSILGEEALDSYPFAKELRHVGRIRTWFEEHMAKAGNSSWGYDVPISHGWVRLIKSVSILYLDHLRGRRDAIASRETTSMSMLEALDQQLARFAEKTELGVFRNATLHRLLINQLPKGTVGQAAPTPAALLPAVNPGPRPVVLGSIEIRDPELRKRCLDLFAQFREDGQHNRLDTVVNEATRILEDRLRALSGASQTCVGVGLAEYAFGPKSPRLIVSDVGPEQEAAHLLYRGVFGFVRNSVHHRLVHDLQPERVLQIVGMVDYLISVAEAARRDRAEDVEITVQTVKGR